MRKLLYVHPEESIAYLIDRIENTEDATIYLAADDHPGLFTDPVNMKLLVREAQALGKDIVIVSENPTVLITAKSANVDTITASVRDLERENTEAGISAADQQNVQQVEEDVPVKIVRDEDGVTATPASEPYEEDLSEEDLSSATLFSPPESDYEHPYDESMRKEETRERAMKRSSSPLTIRFIAASFAVLALVIGGAFYILSPKLTVQIVPKKEVVRFDFSAIADTTISTVNVDDGHIPGQMITVEKEVSDIFTATGKSDQAAKAEGTVALYNEYSSSPQSLVRNTRLRSPDGKIFRLTAQATVPGATVQGGKVITPGTVSVSVVADQAGVAYNIGPSEFSIPGFEGTDKFTKFRGVSTTAMAGGSAREGYVATAGDLDVAKKAMTDGLISAAKQEVEKNIPKGSVILPSATQQSAMELFSDAPDSDGKYTARLKATFSVFVFSENDIAALAEHELAKRLLPSQKSLPHTRVLSYEGEEFKQGKTALSFTVKANELVSGVVNVDALRESLAGKGEVEIRSLLKEYDTMESAEVIFSPRWISLAPENTKRIIVTIEDQ